MMLVCSTAFVPLQMVRAVGENDFGKIGFKTRYGLVNNPHVGTADPHATAGRATNTTESSVSSTFTALM